MLDYFFKEICCRSIKCQKSVLFAEKNQWLETMSAMPTTRIKEGLIQTFKEFVLLSRKAALKR